MNHRLLAVSLNTRIHDKPPAWREEYADNWQSGEAGIGGLLDAILKGHAFVAAAMRGSHRSSAAFLHADLAVVDIDHGLDLDGFRSHPLARHACLTYTSSSHREEPGQHRFRVLFRLPERVTDPDLYKAIVTALIKALGGDKSCSDPCRLFYGNSRCEHWLGADDACLPESFIEDARKEWLRQHSRYEEGSSDLDPTSIERAIHVLDQVLPPTADGERERFVRITAAAASAGEVLFPAWCDWAARGHHGSGKNRRQASEKFFRGFSGKSSLATLFYLASEHDPDWREDLPEHLRRSDVASSRVPIGYSHEEYMGYDDMPPQRSKYKTQSMYDLIKPRSQPQDSNTDAPPQFRGPDDEPEIQVSIEEPEYVDPEFMGDPDEPLLISSGTPHSQEPGTRGSRGKAKGKASGGDSSDLDLIQAKVRVLYPNLRFNRLTLATECGPRERPVLVEDADKAYILVSAGEGRVFSKQLVQDIIHAQAQGNSYNPVTDFLDSCASEEPIDYFDTMASTLLGLPEEGPENPRFTDGRLLADVIISRFLIAAVARARNPGCPMGWMPILTGPQNVGKSNFLAYLTPRDPVTGTYGWCPTVQQGISYIKERPHVLHAGWIVNLDEVERFFQRRYSEELKNLVTVPVDRSRRLYENERSFPRSFVLAGCTNSDSFLVDPTGNRRFMAIRITGVVSSPEDPTVRVVDLDRVKRDCRRIWAAAQRAYEAGSPYEFSSYETNQVEHYLDRFRVDTPLTEALRRVLARNVSHIHKGRPAYTLSDIFSWLDLPLSLGSSETRRITDELRRLGYRIIRIRTGSGYESPRNFWQSDTPESLPDGPGLLSDWADDTTRRR